MKKRSENIGTVPGCFTMTVNDAIEFADHQVDDHIFAKALKILASRVAVLEMEIKLLRNGK